MSKKQDAGAGICEMCGRTYQRTGTSQKYCADCKILNKRRLSTEYRQRQREINNAKAAAEARAERRSEKAAGLSGGSEWSLAGKTANEVTAEANALGLSYGRYSALCSSGHMPAWLREQGLTAAQARAKIRAAATRK